MGKKLLIKSIYSFLLILLFNVFCSYALTAAAAARVESDYTRESGIKSSSGSAPARALCVPKGWDRYISCEFEELHNELEKLGWRKLIIDEIRDEEILASFGEFEVILLFEAYDFLERNKAR